MFFTQKWSDRIVMAGLLVGNYFYSIAKKSLASSIPLLKRTLNVSKQDLGDMSSNFSLAYGVSKLVGGAMSDLLPPYILYTVGLFLGAFANLAITGVTDIKAIGYLWMLNGLGQGVGGPALSRVVVDLFPSNIRASVWSNLTFACNLGYLTSTALLGPFSNDTWQGPFLVTGLGSFISAAIMGVNYVIFLRPASKNAEAPPSSDAKKGVDTPVAAPSSSTTDDNKTSDIAQEVPRPAVVPAVPTPQPTPRPTPQPAPQVPLSMPLVSLVVKSVLLFAANFLAYFIGKGISDWTALYLMEYMQYKEGPRMQVLEIVLWSEVGGIVGSVLVGKLSDCLHNRKSLACALFTVCCILGMWSLALHTPLYATTEDSYYSYALADGTEHTSDASITGISSITSITAIAGAVVPALTPDRDTCVDPSAFQSGDHNLCKNIDATNIVHPLQQCQSVLMGTIHVMFPRADSSTLLLNQYATSLGNIISTYINMYITTDPYVTMRMVLFIVGFGINGPKTLVALELMELLPKHLCGTLTGVAGLVAQVGAACAGKYVAHTILQEGWCTFVALLTVSSVLLAVILFLSALI